MKTTSFIFSVFCATAAVLAQEDPGPSPTESVGCVAHGDHWDCEGPRETPAPAAPQVTPVTPVEEEGDDHGAGEGVLPPSPTESVGCVAHGDHWDCEGPRETGPAVAPVVTTTVAAPATTPVPEEEVEDDDEAGAGVPPPPPTETAATATLTTTVSAVGTITNSPVYNGTTPSETLPPFTGAAPIVNAGSVGTFGLMVIGALGGLGLAY